MANPISEAGRERELIAQTIHTYCSRNMIMTYLDAEEDCEGLAAAIQAALSNTSDTVRVREAVAVAIERADRQTVPDGYADGATGQPAIHHDEVSDWSAWLADAALSASTIPDVGEGE